MLPEGKYEIEFKSTLNDRNIGEESAFSGRDEPAEIASTILVAVESKRHLAARLGHMNSLCNPQPLPDHDIPPSGALFWEKRDLMMLITDEAAGKEAKTVMGSFNLILSADSV